MFLTIKKNIQRLSKSPLFKDSFWALVGSVLGKGLSLLAGIIVARFLGKEIYGEYGLIKSTLLYISVFSTLGLGYTGTRYVAKCLSGQTEEIRHIVNVIYKVTFFASLCMAFILFIFATHIAILLKAPDIVTELRLTSIIIIVNAINTSQIGIMAGLKLFKETAINNTYSGIITFISSALLTYIYGLTGALIALLVSMLFNAIINHRTVHRTISQYTTSGKYTYSTREIVTFSIPIALQESLYSVVTWLGSYMIIIYADYGELGINSAALQWSSVVLFIPGVLKNVILSHFSSSEERISLRKKMVLINLFATVIPCILIAAFSKQINHYYGPTYTNLYIVLIISCSGSIFSSISSVIIYELISLGKNWSVFLFRLFRDICVLGISWLLLSQNHNIQASILVNIVLVSVYAIFMCILFLYIKYCSTIINKHHSHEEEE